MDSLFGLHTLKTRHDCFQLKCWKELLCIVKIHLNIITFFLFFKW